MSVTDLTTKPAVAVASTPTPPRGVSASTWARMALACAILLVSGGLRWWQTQRFNTLLDLGRESPFPLEELPLTLGPWRGEPAKLDEQIAESTGSTDYTLRTYVNQATGVKVDVIVLYGPATAMFIHKPEICYPNAGFEPCAASSERTIEADQLHAPFRSLIYKRGEGGRTDRQEVYYSWRINGRWSPEAGTVKQLERIPGMYKVQLARSVTEHERRDVGNPCEALLEALLPALEQRVKRPSGGRSS